MSRPTGPALLLALCAALILAGTPDAAGSGTPPADPTHPPVTERTTTGSGDSHTGIVVDDGEEVRTVCVRFEEDSITGEDLLERSGLDLTVAHYGTLGAAVCAIDGVGCPAEDCLCAGSYWSYWLHDEEAQDGWRTSPIGATARDIRDGDLDARVWGDGRRRPPPLDLGDVCEPTGDEPVEVAADAVEEEGLAGVPLDVVWFVLAVGGVLAIVWWRRRQRTT